MKTVIIYCDSGRLCFCYALAKQLIVRNTSGCDKKNKKWDLSRRAQSKARLIDPRSGVVPDGLRPIEIE